MHNQRRREKDEKKEKTLVKDIPPEFIVEAFLASTRAVSQLLLFTRKNVALGIRLILARVMTFARFSRIQLTLELITENSPLFSSPFHAFPIDGKMYKLPIETWVNNCALVCIFRSIFPCGTNQKLFKIGYCGKRNALVSMRETLNERSFRARSFFTKLFFMYDILFIYIITLKVI